MLRRLKLRTPFLDGLGILDLGANFSASTLVAIYVGLSAIEPLRFLVGEPSISASFSSSESARWRFLLSKPCGIAGRPPMFSLFLSGNVQGIVFDRMLGLTWRMLDWPGDAPNPRGDLPKSMVLSMRNVKVPGTDRGPILASCLAGVWGSSRVGVNTG